MAMSYKTVRGNDTARPHLRIMSVLPIVDMRNRPAVFL